VLVVDDQLLFAEAIQVALRSGGIGKVEVERTLEGALELLRRRRVRPHVVLIDLPRHDRKTLASGARVAGEFPGVKIVGMTTGLDPRKVRDALRLGFSGMLSKDTHISRLADAIRAVAEGEVVVTEGLGQMIRASNGFLPGGIASEMPRDAALLASQLTRREKELLQLLSEGASSVQIAESLHISRHTVRTHVQSVLGKLGVHSRLEAAAFAVRYGLVQTPRHAG
jgi:two-component system nitrate/nitrite response regulator NarL